MIAARKPKLPRLHLTAWLVEIELKHVQQVFSGRGVEIQAIAQRPRSRVSHAAHRIFQKRLQLPPDRCIGRDRRECVDRVLTHQRARMAELGLHRALNAGFTDPTLQQQRGTRFPIRHLITAEQRNEAVTRRIIAFACFGDQIGPHTSFAILQLGSPPLVRGLNGPFGRFVGVALVAGVWDAVLLGQPGIGNGETMIMTRMTLHVHRLRHVAVDALVSGAFRAVKTMCLRRDDRRIRESTLCVAAHAELVARQEGFHAVHVMAVHAAHARVMHAAAHEAGEFVVLIPDLPVRMIRVAVIDDRELVVIEKGLARHEIARELAAPRVTARAVVQMLIPGPRGECGVALLARMRCLPLVVCLHRPVAGLTTHRHLRHRGFVAILGHIVVFAQARVVTARAHLIPHHAAASPVAPLAGLAIFSAIDIEPVTLVRIETGLHRLQTTAAAIHEDLPQRIVTDHALHFVRRDLSAESERRHDVVRALFRRGGALRAMREDLLRHKGRLIELRVRFPLRETVVGGLPLRVFIRMAARAGL